MSLTDVLPGLSAATLEICEWAGVDHHTAREDIERVRSGEWSEADLMRECVAGLDDGAGEAEWAEYVAAVIAAARAS